MNSIFDIVEGLIDDLSENENLRDITFIKAYDADDYNPSQNTLTAVFNIDELKRRGGFIQRLYRRGTYGDIFSAKLIIRLYGGNYVFGDGLTKALVRLRNEIALADSDGFFDSGVISSICYEKETGAIYRELTFNIEYVLCEAML